MGGLFFLSGKFRLTDDVVFESYAPYPRSGCRAARLPFKPSVQIVSLCYFQHLLTSETSCSITSTSWGSMP